MMRNYPRFLVRNASLAFFLSSALSLSCGLQTESATDAEGRATGDAQQEESVPRSLRLESILSEQQFNSLFPERIPFYTFQGLAEAVDATPGFAKTGSIETRRREVAAMLANAAHESDRFRAVREYNQANWPHYCDPNNTESPCVPGQQYYGRGPIQLSWNFNYGAAGRFLNLPLLENPDLVATVPKIAWQTMLWFWMTQSGAGSMSCHQAIVDDKGFGETIRTINGSLECHGKSPGAVGSRIEFFKATTQALGVSTGGGNLGC